MTVNVSVLSGRKYRNLDWYILFPDGKAAVVTVEEQPAAAVVGCCCRLLVAEHPCNMLVYPRYGSAQTVVRAATRGLPS